MKCDDCGETYDKAEAKKEFYARFGDFDADFFDENYPGLCGPCAIVRTQSDMNIGIAIDMVNGELAYDEDHVEKYL
jgi:hypothetical protein